MEERSKTMASSGSRNVYVLDWNGLCLLALVIAGGFVSGAQPSFLATILALAAVVAAAFIFPGLHLLADRLLAYLGVPAVLLAPAIGLLSHHDYLCVAGGGAACFVGGLVLAAFTVKSLYASALKARAARDLSWLGAPAPQPDYGEVEATVIGLVNGVLLTIIGAIACISGLCCHQWSPFVEISALRGHTAWVRAVAFLPDGERVFSYDDNTMRVWNASGVQELYCAERSRDALGPLTIAPRAGLILAASPKRIRFWEADQWSSEKSLSPPTDNIQAMAFVGNGPDVLCAAKESTYFWNVRSGAGPRPFDGKINGAKLLAVSLDGQWALSVDEANAVQIWDVRAGRELRRLPEQTEIVTALAVSPDGSLALLGTDRGKVSLWATETGVLVRQFEGHTNTVTHLAFSPDSRRALSSSYDKTVRLWDLAGGEYLGSFPDHNEPVFWTDFAPNGRTAISCGADKIIRIWRLPQQAVP
jgi:WD40 repeat protein